MLRAPFLTRRLSASPPCPCPPPPSLPPHKFSKPFHLTKNPPFLQPRLALFTKLWSAQRKELDSRAKEAIRVILPDGSERKGEAWVTTPLSIARSISPRLGKESLIALVKPTKGVPPGSQVVSPEIDDGEPDLELWDMHRELESDCYVKFLTFEDDRAKRVFWHSSAHLLGACLERLYGVQLCVGPAIDCGFYYDAYMGSDSLSQEHFGEIEKAAADIVAMKEEFQRVVVTREEAMELFEDNPFKRQMVERKVAQGQKTTAYRCGDLIDLCKGPHLPHTGLIKSFSVTKNSSSYWLGNSQNDSLQRIYGVSFPDKKLLDEYSENQRKIAERDHHTIGRNQELYFWHLSSPGSTFFLPAGTRIYNRLIEFIRREYRYRGFSEVLTPNMFNCDLWKVSGHYQKYRADMFLLDIEGQEWGLKPMNCPGHCLMFDHSQRSYKDLPIRYADFGVLHRNEASGALSGLTRVRRFQQDDGHVFCRKDQISSEVLESLEFLSHVYAAFGFQYELELSTRPTNALGNEELWRSAEEQLAEALKMFGKPWKVNPGDGAFYGPKIDIKVFDAMKRRHQCGTIQLDFNLPKRFNLQFKTESQGSMSTDPLTQYEDISEKPCKPGFERPVIIHRAILGSMERMMAVLSEHYGGKWPFWLSPRQVIVVPVSEKFGEYAEKVKTTLELAGLYTDLDMSGLTLNKKIRNAQVSQYNFICVVGAEEAAAGTVDVRDREANKSLGKFTLPRLIDHLGRLQPTISLAENRVRASSDLIEVKYRVDLKDVEERLSTQEFLAGGQPGAEDWRVFEGVGLEPDAKRLPKVHGWYMRLKSQSSL